MVYGEYIDDNVRLRISEKEKHQFLYMEICGAR